MLDISLLDLIGQWRPFTFAAVNTVSESAGSGFKRWSAHWEAMARKRQAMQEDEEILAMLSR